MFKPEPPVTNHALLDTAQVADIIPHDAATGGTLSGQRIVVYGMNYSPEFAGVGKYTGEIVEHFAAEGADVAVITTPPHYPGWAVQTGYANRFSAQTRSRLAVYRCPLTLGKKMRGIWRLVAPVTFALTSAPVAIWQILRRKPDVVFIVEPTLFAAPAALLAARLVGAHTVLHVQDLEVDAAFAIGHLSDFKLLKAIGSAFERACLAQLDTVVTISDRMADKLAQKGVPRERLAIVRNWVDLDHIRPLAGPNPYRSELGYSEDDFIVLYSGNIGAKQGLSVLLDAAEMLVSDPRIKFIVAGEGPAKAHLTKRYGHQPNIRFLPFQPYEKLNAFLNLPDLHALTQDPGAADLVLPSKLGGMLASGRSIVVTADDGTELADFVRGAATVVQPGSATALASAIRAAAYSIDVTGQRAVAAAKARELGKRSALTHLVSAIGAEWSKLVRRSSAVR
ncbi:WcaI family glycosyltransferase [Chthonobacter rhizosphaerae]|uniref:WcaI family glycosyltransferase n=1 Tax=Chthonobacter rhizosphaerae TaxID=2735553 RepID=UPI0015EEB055|nr:WcaI family glycosyltransferase [Chthonobacter rhizosphaerae]